MDYENIPYGAQINYLSKLFRNSIKELCNKKGINATYSSIIMFLTRVDDGATQNEIAEYAHLKAPTVSLTLKNMEIIGLITKETKKEDSRKVIVKLTEQGYELNEQIRECYAELEKKMINQISNEDLATFKWIISRMKNNLENLD